MSASRRATDLEPADHMTGGNVRICRIADVVRVHTHARISMIIRCSAHPLEVSGQARHPIRNGQIADYSLPAGRCWPVAVARRISIRRAASRQSAPHAGAVSPHFLLPLGYEPYDAHLCRPGVSPVTLLAWAGCEPNVAWDPHRLCRIALSRGVSFTDRFTSWSSEATGPQ
jgi:hypothetical protein